MSKLVGYMNCFPRGGVKSVVVGKRWLVPKLTSYPRVSMSGPFS